MNENKIIVLSGGFSEEKDVSSVTASEILKNIISSYPESEMLDPAHFNSYSDMINDIKDQNPYIVFNGLHGAEGEDGRIQSLLELEKIAYTGSSSHSCSLAMDKHISGILAESAGIRVPERMIFTENEDIFVDDFQFPIVVKPNNSGSSVGISVVMEGKEIESALESAFRVSDIIIIERFIPGNELTVTILGDEILPPVEIKPNEGWYDYENKYTSGNTEYICPAELSENETKELQRKAKNIYDLLGCEIYGRVDFRYDGEDFYFLEVNTLPGLTPVSLTPMAAKAAGYSFLEMLKRVIELSKIKHRSDTERNKINAE
jgi:D-alanine-D-alanine ligase